MGVDYYNVMKVSKNATEEDVKKSYKRLAMKWHPDKNAVNTAEAEAMFKMISEACDVLSDPHKRQIYDLYGEEGLKSRLGIAKEREFAGNGRGFSFSPRNAEDIFDGFFSHMGVKEEKKSNSTTLVGNNGRRKKLAKAAPMETKLGCTLEDLYKGTTRKMKISRVTLDEAGKLGTVDEVLAIEIKPGWKKGTKITFPEKGNHESGCAPGDLIFVVDEKPHPTFKRVGNDLIMRQKISLLEALTGKTLLITTLDDRTLTVSVSDVVKPSQEIVIRNEGMPIHKEKGQKGNLRIKFEIKFPSSLTSDQKSDLKRVLSGR